VVFCESRIARPCGCPAPKVNTVGGGQVKNLTRKASVAIRIMRTPASYHDRPGDWGSTYIKSKFGDAVVRELLSAGLIQLGGIPAPVPLDVANRFLQHNMWPYPETDEDFERRKQHYLEIDETLYPSPETVFFLTEQGWVAELTDSNLYRKLMGLWLRLPRRNRDVWGNC
jgi:hypothetical protein